jgi:hypothetical protein
MENHDIDIRNLQFTSEGTGSFFSKTYSEYNWKFVLDGVQRSVSLYHSKILGRRTIYLGKQEICRYQRYTYNFQYSFPIEVHNISIVQSEDSYILKIDEVPFNKLLNEQKLRRFNIIKDTFLVQEKPKKSKRKHNGIKKYLTYNGVSAGIPISRRSEDKKNIFKTNINNSDNDISDIINIDNENNNDASTNKSNINDEEDQNKNGIALSQERFYQYYDREEMSDDISNMAIDGGDSDKDEDEDETENIVEDEDKTLQESFRPPKDDDSIFDSGNQKDENENNINNINNNQNNYDKEKEKEEVENDEKEEDEEEEKVKQEDNYNILEYIKNWEPFLNILYLKEYFNIFIS